METRAYNHITATYYLLAERLLRKRVDALQVSTGAIAAAADKDDVKQVLSPLALSPRFVIRCNIVSLIRLHTCCLKYD